MIASSETKTNASRTKKSTVPSEARGRASLGTVISIVMYLKFYQGTWHGFK